MWRPAPVSVRCLRLFPNSFHRFRDAGQCVIPYYGFPRRQECRSSKHQSASPFTADPSEDGPRAAARSTSSIPARLDRHRTNCKPA